MSAGDDAGRTESRIRGRALRSLLNDLSSAAISHTSVLPPGSLHAESPSDTGWMIFRSTDEEIAIAPVLPLQGAAEREGFIADQLLAQLESRPTTAIVLVRLGRYAVGVFRGTELVSSKTETRYVGSQHKAGGWSQKRFARIREKQIRELFDKVCETARDKLSPYESDIERLWLGGDRYVLNGLLERCRWLNRFSEQTADYRLNVPTPDLAGLKKSIEDALAYRVIRTSTYSAEP